MTISSMLPLQNAFASWWFDPLVATFGFGVPVFVYTYQEIQTGTSTYVNFKQFFSKGTGDDKRPSAVLSLVAYWVGVFFWIQIIPQAGGGKLPYGIPTSFSALGTLIAEVCVGVIQYDFIFFFLHWSMHELKFLRFLHKQHHHPKALEARHVLTHSLLDGVLQVIVNIAVQRHTPWGSVKSRLARALHNLIVTWMLTESHTSTSRLNLFRKYFRGVRDHRKHHLEQSRHPRYQQFFGYLDDARFYVKSLEFGWKTKRGMERKVL